LRNILKETTRAKLQKLLKDIETLPFNTKQQPSTMAFMRFFLYLQDAYEQREVNNDNNIDLIIMGTQKEQQAKAVAKGVTQKCNSQNKHASILVIPENNRF